MSTPEQPDGAASSASGAAFGAPRSGDAPELPPQTQLPVSQAPRPTETPTQWAPTPGTTPSMVRHSGVPTVPELDTAFAQVLARMANDLFKPVPPAAVTTSPAPQPPIVAAPGLAPGALGTAAPAPLGGERAGVRGDALPQGTTAAVPTTPSFASPSGFNSSSGYPLGALGGPTSPPQPPSNAHGAEVSPSQPAHAPLTPPLSPTRGEGARSTHAEDVSKADAAEHLPDSPFSAPLRFDSLGEAPRVPHLDGGLHTPIDQAAPYWLQPARGEGPQVEPAAQRPPPPEPERTRGIFDAHAVRRQFPILDQRVNGQRLVWLDNAATTQKPQVVIDRLKHFYEHDNSNIHRAAHTLAARATDAYEQARETVRRFINAPSKNDVVFVRGTTEAINLVAQTYGRRHVNEGDEIVISWLEHHANIVPWHRLCAERKATLKVAPVDDRGQIILEEYEKLLGPKTKIVAFSQVSNALGTVTPAREMIELAHRWGAKVLLDGAQAVSHMRVDVQQLDCDFYVFSGHKVFAPTGIGVVFGKAPLLEAMPPWQGGGNMIQDVTFERVVYQGPPAKFEAGTGNIADAIGLGTALDWLMQLGVENVGRYEHELLEYATPKLLAVPGLTLIGTAPDKAGVLSFVLAGQKTEEVGGLLDKEGIAVRSGHHCAQPILRRFGLEASVRASLAPYNTVEDIDALCAALHRLQAGKPRTR